MRAVVPYNGSLLAIIARDGKITYDELKEKHCVPTPPGVISSKNVMFDPDLKVLEAEGVSSQVKYRNVRQKMQSFSASIFSCNRPVVC